MQLRLEPKDNIVVARLLDITRTESGLLHLPDMQTKGASVLAHVESVGPAVKKCQPGDVVLYHACGHCWLMGGTFHRAIIQDEHILCVVHGYEESALKYADEKLANGPSRIQVASPA